MVPYRPSAPNGKLIVNMQDADSLGSLGCPANRGGPRRYEDVQDRHPKSTRRIYICFMDNYRISWLRRFWRARRKESNRARDRPDGNCIERSSDLELERLPRGPILRCLAGTTSTMPTSGGIPYLPASVENPPTTPTFTDTTVVNGTTYYYAVAADGSWGGQQLLQCGIDNTPVG